MKSIAQQSGNALVMVLVITGLFALLTIVVTDSFDGTASLQYNQKQVETGVQDMMRYGASLENTIYQMISLNGIRDTEISFASDQDSPATLHENANCTTQICRVFGQGGGGITWRRPPESISADPLNGAYVISGASAIYGHGSDGASAPNAELFLTTEVTLNACLAALDILNIPLNSSSLPPDDDFIRTAFTGAYSATLNQEVDHPDLAGLKAFCFHDTSDAAYYMVYVLYPR